MTQSALRTPARPSSTRSALDPTVAPPSKTLERPTPTKAEPTTDETPTRSTPDETRTVETPDATETAQTSPTPSQAAAGEATWLSHDLVPPLQGQDAAGRSGVLAIGRTRVLRFERTLEGLGGQAPDPQAARHCAALSSATQTLGAVFDQAEAAGDVGGEATTTALRQAQHDLDDAIATLQTSRGGGG